VHAGQYYDENMSAVFLDELEIPSPDYQLGNGSGPHGEQTGRRLEAIEGDLQARSPELGARLRRHRLHPGRRQALFTVAQVDAGLRSFNRRMPEEINRVLTDHVSPIASRRPWRRSSTSAARASPRVTSAWWGTSCSTRLSSSGHGPTSRAAFSNGWTSPQELHPGHDPPGREHRRPVPPAGDLRRARPGRRPGPGRPPAPPADAKGPGAAEAPGPDVGTRAAHRPGWLP
jgi:hypothetical protein